MILAIQKFGWMFRRVFKTPLQEVFYENGYKVIYNPVALVQALEKYHMKKRVDKIHAKFGPIDGIVGSFNPKNGNVMFDVKEIVQMVSNKGSNAIDEELTDTLAHELRHRWQFRNHGKLRLHWDRFAIFFLTHMVIWKIVTTHIFSNSFESFSESEIFTGLVLLLVAVVVTIIGLGVAAIMSYYFSWIERDARRFAKQVVNDPAWQKVFEVSR